MAEKTAAAKKKPAAPVKPVKKAAAKAPMSKGDSFACEECGFVLIVDEVCDCAEEHEFLCCDQPMKAKAAKTAKPRAKVAAKK